ncbi:hypothetical protein S83_059919 [Arachis hypogaea]
MDVRQICDKEKNCTTVPIAWTIPPANWVKLNMDSASCGNLGPASCTSAFQNELGDTHAVRGSSSFAAVHPRYLPPRRRSSTTPPSSSFALIFVAVFFLLVVIGPHRKHT